MLANVIVFEASQVLHFLQCLEQFCKPKTSEDFNTKRILSKQDIDLKESLVLIFASNETHKLQTHFLFSRPY